MFDFELEENSQGKGGTISDPKTIWELMKFHTTTIEEIFEGIDEISEKEFIELKQKVKEFDANVVYPYVIKAGNVDIHLDGVSQIVIPHNPEEE